MGRYAEAFQQSLTDPERFWGAAASGIDWYRPPTLVLDRANPPFYRWFADGVMNTCYNAVDRHVQAGRGDQAALIYDSPVTGTTAPSPTGNCWIRWSGSRASCAASARAPATGW